MTGGNFISILDRLRNSTRASHASIETVPAFSCLVSPDLKASDYVRTLLRLNAFRTSLEHDLSVCFQGRSRASELLDGQGLKALESDLEWFGIQPLDAADLTPPENPSAALGALYVLEGSNLGGRVIGRNISAVLGVGLGCGGSFYCGLTADDARRRWRLLEDILRLEIDECEVPCEPVTEAAVKTFASLEAFMREQ